VHERANHAVTNQHQELFTLEASERTSILPFAHRIQFREISGKITQFAMNQIYKKLEVGRGPMKNYHWNPAPEL
jgi:hypothetical protein